MGITKNLKTVQAFVFRQTVSAAVLAARLPLKSPWAHPLACVLEIIKDFNNLISTNICLEKKIKNG